ncbi:tenomodulin [Gadus chalcogrammus]|uniref:tenomodulin n=1 Tax=Gadus chalcogrammus TaxID=1042646 RepID=UPI0024C4AAFE|nr:tenomodulin [Gadus chalcogrammus]
MEARIQSNSQQVIWKDIETGKEKTARFRTYRRLALILGLVVLALAAGVFSLRYFWGPNQAKVYDHHYKAVVDGRETDSLLEIDPGQRIEIFRMGNGSDEVLEVHDFKNGITGIRFSKHQRCYIKSQSTRVPTVTEVASEDTEALVGDPQGGDMVKVEESQVWVPSEEPIASRAFLLNSKIWEMCQELPIHWISPSPLRDAEIKEEESFEDTPDTEVKGQRFARDVHDDVPVNDYRDAGIELDNRLDDNGYCCQHCRSGYRYCRRYYEPLGGYNPWPYFYQGGRVICQIVMPCNWWIARMLGRV